MEERPSLDLIPTGDLCDDLVPTTEVCDDLIPTTDICNDLVLTRDLCDDLTSRYSHIPRCGGGDFGTGIWEEHNSTHNTLLPPDSCPSPAKHTRPARRPRRS